MVVVKTKYNMKTRIKTAKKILNAKGDDMIKLYEDACTYLQLRGIFNDFVDYVEEKNDKKCNG